MANFYGVLMITAIIAVSGLLFNFRRRGVSRANSVIPATGQRIPGHGADTAQLIQRNRDVATFINNSDDDFAIDQLRQIRNHPEIFHGCFRKYAEENRTLKIALGLLTGYFTLEMVTDPNLKGQFMTAMESLDLALAISSLPVEDEKQSSCQSPLINAKPGQNSSARSLAA